MTDAMMLLLLCLALVVEPAKYLTVYFMEHNRRFQGVGRPGLLNLVTESTSPLTIARQYLSGLLRLQSTRFALILSKCGVASMGEWATRFPDICRKFRRAIRIASANIEWRHCREYLCNRGHLHLLGLCDRRIPFEQRVARFNIFQTIEPCCMRWGMARKIRRSKVNLMSEVWQRVSWRLACIIKLSICDVECRHARCKRSIGLGMEWCHLFGNLHCGRVQENATRNPGDPGENQVNVFGSGHNSEEDQP